MNTLAEVPAFGATLCGLVGLLVGSFLNVVIYRLPREGKRVSDGRSRCPGCMRQIAWYDNIPVASFVVLKGSCRACSFRIPVRYPVIELITGAGFVWVYFLTLSQIPTVDATLWLTLLVRLVVGSALLAASVIDFDFQILPDQITKTGMVVGVLASCAVPELHCATWVDSLGQGCRFEHGLIGALAGLAAGILTMAAIRSTAGYFLQTEAMGLGDVKLMGAMGAFLGMEGIGLALLLGVFVGALMGLLNVVRVYVYRATRMTARGATRPRLFWRVAWQHGRVIPFGPALALGGFATLLFRAELIHFVSYTWPEWVHSALGGTPA